MNQDNFTVTATVMSKPKGENMRIYFPFTSMLIVSIVLTLILNIFSRIFK